MSDSTLEALLDVCAWRVGRPIPMSVYQPRQPRLRALRPRSVRRRAQQRQSYWHGRGLEPPPYNLRANPRRCQMCHYHLHWETEECPECGLDQWNPHLRRWEPNTTKETA